MTDYPKIGDLTEKQRIFCERYCTHWNATKAAIEAGYSEKTANEQGSQNLTKLSVREYIKFIKDNAFEFAGISALRNAQELAKVAYGSGADLREAWKDLKQWEELPDEVKATIAEVTTTTRTILGFESVAELETVKIKQYDKLKALEMLNKMGGYNAPEKLDHSTLGESLNEEKRFVFSDGTTRDAKGNVIKSNQ
jgi:phage terminase small subunit